MKINWKQHREALHMLVMVWGYCTATIVAFLGCVVLMNGIVEGFSTLPIALRVTLIAFGVLGVVHWVCLMLIREREDDWKPDRASEIAHAESFQAELREQAARHKSQVDEGCGDDRQP